MPDKVPDISVVMSVYNCEQYLREAIDSVVSQKDVNFEFIIVNDGSTDKTAEIIESYAGNEKTIRVINQKNSGLTKALIRACDEARGDFIARQDADDVSMPGRLKSLYALINSRRNIMLASSWGTTIGPGGEELGTTERPENPQEATQQMLNEKLGPPSHGSVMFRKSAYQKAGGYRDVFYYGQDADLWLRMVPLGLVAYVQESLYAYRCWPENISSAGKDLQARFGELGQLCRTCRLKNEPEEKYLQMAEQLRDQIIHLKKDRRGRRSRIAGSYYLIASSLEKQRDAKAIHYFWLAAKSYPLSLRAWIRLFTSVFRCGSGNRSRELSTLTGKP